MFTEIGNVSGKSFDFVIVGGGTAGLCLAARLTEDPNCSVLVLETGEANLNDPSILIPTSYSGSLALFGRRPYDWMFKTTPQKHSNNNVFYWNRGKGLGGSSSNNFLFWIKPPVQEIDDIERLGNPGWNSERFGKYLAELEGSHESDKQPTEQVNAIKLVQPTKISELEFQIYRTWIDMGIAEGLDLAKGSGVFLPPKTIDPATNTRSYSTTAFYVPNSKHPNLHILLTAQVHRIITQAEGPGGRLTATGVEFLHNDNQHIVYVGKEVVLCAGALKSPQILELSGIGRRTVLHSLNIPVKLELSGVGENVQEHIWCSTTYELPDEFEDHVHEILRDAQGHSTLSAEFLRQDDDVIARCVPFAFASFKTISDRANEIFQAAKENIMKNWSNYTPGLREQYKIQLARLENGASSCEMMIVPEFLSFPNVPKPGKKYVTIVFAYNHQFSRGSIHAVSGDPSVDPEIDPHYMEEHVDLQIFVELFKFIRKMCKHGTLKEIITSSDQEINPGPHVETDEQIADHLKKYCGTIFHTAGSLSMLPLDKSGVVDNKLKVYGTSNIRVADLSIIPLHFGTHPLATVYAIAAQAADIIRGKI